MSTGLLRRLRHAFLRDPTLERSRHETQLMATGKLLSWQCRKKRVERSFADVEFKIFSQFGDDGIIQWLVQNVHFPNRTFIEFGVENYRESNTRFLLMNDNWSGLIMDGSERSVREIVASEYYWRHDLQAVCAFIDRDNINQLISAASLDREVGILHIDLDGNDYWIWKSIDVIEPVAVIVEYNSVFGIERPITVPYDASFVRSRKHYSNLYFGTSLAALCELADAKGYGFIGCNSAGNNAYFVRQDRLNDDVRPISLDAGFVESKYRESRDRENRLTYASRSERAAIIRGMPVYNVRSNAVEPF